MHDIFVSYSSKDREIARPLVNALKEQGFSIWWDPELKTGEVFDKVIETALKDARCCLVLWSRHSVFSDWVRAEATKARARGILLPVLLEAVPLPAPFNILQSANFTRWSGALPFSEFDRLVASIEGVFATESLGNVTSKPSLEGETAAIADTEPLFATNALLGPNRPLSYPQSDVAEPVIHLGAATHPNWGDLSNSIKNSGQIVFHAVGDTGNVNATREQEVVARALIDDFEHRNDAHQPAFLFHLGDIVYNFGERERYYDQFYDPYRDYPGPIFAIPGHHDGMVVDHAEHPTLGAFIQNFCALDNARAPRSDDVERNAQVQPGVYFTLDAPFVRILALYSNCLGGAGIVSSQNGQYPDVPDRQLTFLSQAMTRIKRESYPGAVIVAVHHPPYCVAAETTGRGDSRNLLQDLDEVCRTTGVWPHAVLSAHSDNYQRFTRFGEMGETPFIVSGNGGHRLVPLAKSICTPVLYVSKTNSPENERVVFERFDHDSYGYLRVRATSTKLQVEYVRTSGEIFDSVAIDLLSRKLLPSTVPLL